MDTYSKVVASNNKKVLEDKFKRCDGSYVLVVDKITTGKYPYTIRNIKTNEIRQYKYVKYL